MLGDIIIYAYVLDGKGGAREATDKEIEDRVPGLWLHLKRDSTNIRLWFKTRFGSIFNERSLDRLLSEGSRPRFYQSNGFVFLNLRGINLNAGSDPEDMISMRLWTDSKIIITLTKDKLMALDDLIADLKEGCGPLSFSAFISTLTSYLLDRIGGFIDSIEEKLDIEEEKLSGDIYNDERLLITTYRLRCSRLRRYILPQREALITMLNSSFGLSNEEFQRSVREEIDRITRYIEDLEFAKEQAILLHESNGTRLSERLNKNTYILSVVAVLFLPLGFFTGLLGVNLSGIPWSESYWSFGAFSFLIIAIFLIEYLFLKWKRWI